MMTPRKALNKLKWTPGMDLGKAEIWFVHRGAPGDLKVVAGRDIRNLDRYFFETDEARIPYHRVIRIEYEGKVVFERNRSVKR